MKKHNSNLKNQRSAVRACSVAGIVSTIATATSIAVTVSSIRNSESDKATKIVTSTLGALVSLVNVTATINNAIDLKRCIKNYQEAKINNEIEIIADEIQEEIENV